MWFERANMTKASAMTSEFDLEAAMIEGAEAYLIEYE